MKKKELPKGFTCKCDTWHDFAPYVYDHWDVELKHLCGNCKREHSVFRGNAVLVGNRMVKS